MSAFSFIARGLLVASALFLYACASGEAESGIEASIAAVHHTHGGGRAHPHRAKHSSAEYKTFRRADGMRIDLERGQLKLSAVTLEPCTDLAALAQRLADLLLPAAHAHGGSHGASAAGAIDVLAPDLDTVVALGSLPAMPGRYCGLTVELLPVDGTGVDVAPCYFPNTVGVAELPAERTDENAWLFEHDCIAAIYDGPVLRRTLELDAPLTLDATRRAATITVSTAYDRWFEDVRMELLETGADEQRRLAEQMLATLQVYAIE